MGRTIISADGRFEWDEEKDEINRQKHGFGFVEILEVFDDPCFFERYDRQNSTFDEDRYIGIGTINIVFVVLICYTYKNDRIRLFSARKTKPEEMKEYYGLFRKTYT